MAVKFRLPDGSTTDIVVHFLQRLPRRHWGSIRDLFLAIGASKPGDPPPTALDKFLSTHPTAEELLEAPEAGAGELCNPPLLRCDTFKFTNAKGKSTFGRYQLQPVAGEQFLDGEKVSKMAPDYLTDEIRERVGRRPAKFMVLLQVAEQGDKLDDPSIAWPDTRKKVELGTIVIAKASPDSHAAEKKLLFLPGALVPGIEACGIR